MNPIKLFTLILFIGILTACNRNNRVSVRGSYPDGAGEYIQVDMVNSASPDIIDSVEIRKNGDFKFTLELENPELITIQNSAGENINLLPSPGENITLEIESKSFRSSYKVEGSEESEKIRQLVTHVDKSKVKLDSLLKKINNLDDIESEEGKRLSTEYMTIFNEQKKHNINFIIHNINSLSSIYALYQRVAPNIYIFNNIQDLQYFKIVADSLQTKYPESSFVQSLAVDVKKRIDDFNRAQTINKFAENNVIETGLINLEIENQFGDPVSLKSLNGKVVMLLFWATWNEESKETARILKKIYDKYHAKGFEIYAVGLESDKNTWRNTIDFEEFPWINVSELTYPNSFAAKLYNVQSIPTTYLINKEGDIIAKNISPAAIGKWLDNLL